MRKHKFVGTQKELLLQPIKTFDVSAVGYEGLHQLRVFKEITPGVKSTGIFFLLANQHLKPGTEELPIHSVAFYTGRIEQDAIPAAFIDLEKLVAAMQEVRKLQEQYAAAEEPKQQPLRPLFPAIMIPVKAAV